MYTFKVEKMMCGQCVATVSRAAQITNPDARIDVVLHRQLVHIRSKSVPDAFAEAITLAGFPASQIIAGRRQQSQV